MLVFVRERNRALPQSKLCLARLAITNNSGVRQHVYLGASATPAKRQTLPLVRERSTHTHAV